MSLCEPLKAFQKARLFRFLSQIHKLDGTNKCLNYVAPFMLTKPPLKLTLIENKKGYQNKVKSWRFEKEFYDLD